MAFGSIRRWSPYRQYRSLPFFPSTSKLRSADGGEHHFQPSSTEVIVHGAGQPPEVRLVAKLAAVTREQDVLKVAQALYGDESTYWLGGIEAVFQGSVTPYIEPIGPAPVGGIQGQKARETLSEFAHGELRKPSV